MKNVKLKMRKFFIQVALLLVLVSPVMAQPISDAMKSSREMARLRQVLFDTVHLSFTALV
jgi:hypothetical protein